LSVKLLVAKGGDRVRFSELPSDIDVRTLEEIEKWADYCRRFGEPLSQLSPSGIDRLLGEMIWWPGYHPPTCLFVRQETQKTPQINLAGVAVICHQALVFLVTPEGSP
jgi:hypothetical protein